MERDDLTSCSPVMVELWMRMREVGYEDGNDMGRFEGMCEIRGTTCLIGLRIPRIGVRNCRIGYRTSHFGYGKLTWT